ncbi:MAG: hypothetical protein IKE91_01030 [Clostridia bacterium]|nr:hypothetical protein [Clostridia bacterium]
MISSITSVFTVMMFAIVFFAFFVNYLLNALGYMGCMKKAGEATWKAWVPIYNEYTMFKIVNLKSFLIIFKIIYIVIAIVYLSFTFAYVQDISEKADNIVNNSISSNSIKTTTTTTKNGKKVTTSVDKATVEDGEELLESLGSMSIGLIIFSMLNSLFGIAVFVISILFAINISKAYGLGGGTIAGMILIPNIFILIIGFGSSKYQGSYQPTQATTNV